jgi:outer membrane lipoprotein-sorting protein
LRRNLWFKIREAGLTSFDVAEIQNTWWLLFLCLVAGMASASAQAGSSVPSAETIIVRMAQARAENRARLRPYVVTRSYKLFSKDGSKAKFEVIADVAFIPPDSKKYTIQETKGSGLGQILVRRMLTNEAEVTKDHVATDLSVDNYDFRFIREADVNDQRCFMLELLPRRNEQHLLHGNIWVDADTYLLRRFEGRLAKAPSWWVRDVRITFAFSEVGGMWLQTASESVANVRILGRSTMVSRDVKYKITELVATASSDQTNLMELMLSRPFRFGVVPNPPE